jgi:hypothetical protein
MPKSFNVGQGSCFETSKNKDMSAWPSDVLMKKFSNVRTCAWTQGFTLTMQNFL